MDYVRETSDLVKILSNAKRLAENGNFEMAAKLAELAMSEAKRLDSVYYPDEQEAS